MTAYEEISEVDLVDLTGAIKPAAATELAALCRFALETDSGTSGWTVALVFTDDEHIARLHREFIGIPGPTDILTFADDEERGGDIVISVDQADRQRQDDDWSLLEELRFLTVHGALHLTGWDDATDTQRQEMLDRQRALITQFLADSASTR